MVTEGVKVQGQKREKPEEINRVVGIEGRFLGREVGEYKLWGHSEKGQEAGADMLGNDAFTEIYFETISGNLYKIYPTRDGRWAMVDARSNRGKGQEAKGVDLAEEDLQKGVLRVGKSFGYGKGGRTTEIAKITCVSGNRVYDAEYLKKYTVGNTSNIRDRFKRIIMPPERRT